MAGILSVLISVRGFSATDYAECCRNYAQGWKIIDDTLYRLCRDYPQHGDQASVNAKIIIIGRTYATGIERKVASQGTQGSSISQVAEFFFTNGREVDRWFGRVGNISEPLTPSNASEILTIHGLMVGRLMEITIGKQSARSFVSKYMHFHNAAVPIYDSVALKFLRVLVPSRSVRDLQIPVHADPEYADYVWRFLTLYQSISSQGISISVRSLDNYLISKG